MKDQVLRYLADLAKLDIVQSAILAVEDSVHRKPKGLKDDAAAKLALIKELAQFYGKGKITERARAILHILESECGLSRAIIADGVLNAPRSSPKTSPKTAA